MAFEPTLANPLMLQSNCFDLFDMVSETRAEQKSSQEGEPLGRLQIRTHTGAPTVLVCIPPFPNKPKGSM